MRLSTQSPIGTCSARRRIGGEGVTDLTSFIRTELFVLVPVLYAVGVALKKSPLADWLIPYLLGLLGVGLSALYLATQETDIPTLLFSALTQGVLCAACSVYANNLIKQFSHRKDVDTADETQTLRDDP